MSKLSDIGRSICGKGYGHADLYPKKSFTEKFEGELILLFGFSVILLLFIFAFIVVGQMDIFWNSDLA
ncbi:MAG: hypothetical protein KO202_07715 [Methanobacteriaceae archaeon]|jgi:hypothetical protein|nr:hypothetical protein [Methanobacteriaceae archaeon]